MESTSRIQDLEKEIRDAKFIYYKKPEEVKLTDKEFDLKVKELEKLSPDSPVLKEIGAPPTYLVIKHYKKMYSLDNAMNWDETSKFLNRFDDQELFVASLKLDGASAELTYLNGNLASCSTRGDGLWGEACNHLSMIVPNKIDHNGIFCVYGEVVIPKFQFEKVQDIYSSPRNLAAGALMTKDNQNILVERGAKFVAYGSTEQADYFTSLAQLEIMKFNVVPAYLITKKELENVFLEMEEERDSRYETLGPSDGVVVRVDNLIISERYGYGEKAPKFAIAMKFETEEVEVIVKNIRWDVSKNGRMTPVIEFDSVRLEGADVTNCTIHNARMLIDHSVGIGGIVLITRSGGVIPKYLRTIKPSLDVQGPVPCPSCNSSPSWDENRTYLICNNSDCPAQLADQLESFFNKLDFKGFGEKSCEYFVKYGVTTPGKVFKLEVWDYASILGFSEWHAQDIYEKVQKLKKNMDYQKFIYALGIDMVGNRYSKKLIEKISSEQFKIFITFGEKSCESSYSRWYNGISSIFDGGITSQRITESIIKKRDWIQEILDSGVIFKEYKKTSNNSISFVITGTLSKPRKEFQDVIEKSGFEYQDSLTKGTMYLVSGENVGKNKLDKASKYGTKVISEDRFWEIINGGE